MENQTVFSRVDVDLKSLFKEMGRIVYLAGAGISMDAPSSLPSAVQIMRDLVAYCAPPEATKDILDLPGLRYEFVVEKVKSIFDYKLQFLKYLDTVVDPNLIHVFLAREITEGNDVITTNFDYLIEHALLKMVPETQKASIIPIITRQDFTTYQQEIGQKLDTPRYHVVKIHGSRDNLITSQETTDTLITTISSLGRNKEDGETFAIEPFKKPLITSLLHDASLVVMGYSGSDDFDIGPLLRELPAIKRLIWIEHVQGDDVVIEEFHRVDFMPSSGLSRSDLLLGDIRSHHDYPVYRIKAHTRKLMEHHLWEILNPGIPLPAVLDKPSAPRLSFKDWIAPLFANALELRKYRFAAYIFTTFSQYEKSRFYIEKGLSLASTLNDLVEELNFRMEAAQIDANTDHLDSGLSNSQIAIDLAIKLGSDNDVALSYNLLGIIYRRRNQLEKALESYLKALEFFKKAKHDLGAGSVLGNIGVVYTKLNQGAQALEKSLEALKIDEKNGN